MGIYAPRRRRSPAARLCVAGLVATFLAAGALVGIGAASAAIEGPTLTGARTGDLIGLDTALTVVNPRGGDVLVSAFAIDPDGSTDILRLGIYLHDYRQPLRLPSGLTFTPHDLTPSGGDLRLVLTGCSVDEPDICDQPGQQVDIGVDAPIVAVFDQMVSAHNGLSDQDMISGIMWRDQAVEMTTTLTEPDGEVVLGDHHPMWPTRISQFSLVTEGALPGHGYRLHVDMKRPSAVVPDVTYYGTKDLAAVSAGVFTRDAAISNSRILTLPGQRIQHTMVRLSSVVPGRLVVAVRRPEGSGPALASVTKEVTAGQQVTLGWDGWNPATNQPASAGSYPVWAYLNVYYEADRVQAWQQIGTITVGPGQWAFRTITRTVSALRSRTLEGTDDCGIIHAPGTRGWPGSMQIWTRPCPRPPRFPSWTQHRMLVPHTRYGIVSANLEAFGGASLGHPGSTAIAWPFNAHPIGLASRVGWHQVRSFTSIVLDRGQIVCYISTRPTNSYDIGGFRIHYHVRDHLVPL
jgi:hypothetical protein